MIAWERHNTVSLKNGDPVHSVTYALDRLHPAAWSSNKIVCGYFLVHYESDGRGTIRFALRPDALVPEAALTGDAKTTHVMSDILPRAKLADKDFLQFLADRDTKQRQSQEQS